MIRTFQGKTAFITGGASGIGLAIARALAEAGTRIMLADIDGEGLTVAIAGLEASGANVRGVECDVSDRSSVQRAAEETFAAFGNTHIVCNNAGVGSGGQIEEIPPEDWEWIIGVNLMGVVNGIQAFLPHMKVHGESGHIINTSSMAGLLALPGAAPHNASKAGIIAVSETLAAELAGTAIGVSVLCPAFVRTRIAECARTRPRRFASNHTQTQPANAKLSALVNAGLEPDAVARRVLRAITADELYIFTHQDTRAAVEERFRQVLAAFD